MLTHQFQTSGVYVIQKLAGPGACRNNSSTGEQNSSVMELRVPGLKYHVQGLKMVVSDESNWSHMDLILRVH